MKLIITIDCEYFVLKYLVLENFTVINFRGSARKLLEGQFPENYYTTMHDIVHFFFFFFFFF